MTNEKKPYLSVITPVYNRADCVGRCIESVLKQSFNDYELIIINDGSVDNTRSVIEGYLGANIQINFIDYEINKGVNYARNRGIEKARGTFILFLDSDDQLSDAALKLIFDKTSANPGYDHYLFSVSDRLDDVTLPKVTTSYTYADWLSGKINGDFGHVIKPECFADLLFIEKFRLYESLNWLRVLRRNKKQLFIPDVVLCRERDRNDSLTKEAILGNRQSILNSYNYLQQYITWYAADFVEQKQQHILWPNFKKAYLLGLALGRNGENKAMLMQMKELGFNVDKYKLINIKILSPFFFRLLVIKSNYNQFKKNKH